ncbi:MAG: CPBP family glutamic-type intramembrane protease [Pirellulaceae bacterium]|nr:CPBP family glutamic-type intramembrane protease [Pirellulaceae bacterium]
MDATNCQNDDSAAQNSSPAAPWKWVVPLLAVMAIPMVLERFGVVPVSKLQFVGNQRPEGSDWPWLGVVATQALLVGGLLVVFWREYTRSLPWRVSWWTVPVGLLGMLAWVGICELGWEHAIYQMLPGADEKALARSSINPSESFPEPLGYSLFLLSRFTVLVWVIPIAEELLLRGILLRMLQRDDWWAMPMSELSWGSIAISAAYGALTHPNEIFAAIVWFAAVTWWVRWTNRFWDGVMIHAVTNAALGIYVLIYHQWHLW